MKNNPELLSQGQAQESLGSGYMPGEEILFSDLRKTQEGRGVGLIELGVKGNGYYDRNELLSFAGELIGPEDKKV
jgi:hypothetical protein